jgi:hypothetical protein
MTFCLLNLLGMYVFKFAAFANVKRSPFEATSTAFLNGMDCNYLGVDSRNSDNLQIVNNISCQGFEFAMSYGALPGFRNDPLRTLL